MLFAPKIDQIEFTSQDLDDLTACELMSLIWSGIPPYVKVTALARLTEATILTIIDHPIYKDLSWSDQDWFFIAAQNIVSFED